MAWVVEDRPSVKTSSGCRFVAVKVWKGERNDRRNGKPRERYDAAYITALREDIERSARWAQRKNTKTL